MVYTKLVTYIYIFMLVYIHSTFYLHMCISFCSPLRENDSHFDSFFTFHPCDSTHHLSSLEVDAELGAGFDAHATWYGMVIEEIDDEPGQDENLQPGPMVRPQKID